jgi:hypothetical protein
VINWNATRFQLDFALNGIGNDNAVSLIAFEYLSLLIGRSIYLPIFDHIRTKLLNHVETKYLKVNFFTAEKPQPFHLIYPEFEKDKTTINIHLFGFAVAKVEFMNIHIQNTPDFCYLEDLINKESFGALSVAEGKSNKWRAFNF